MVCGTSGYTRTTQPPVYKPCGYTSVIVDWPALFVVFLCLTGISALATVGAIAFALSMNVNTPNKAVIITTTMTVVIMTTLGCGGATLPLLQKLGLSFSPYPQYALPAHACPPWRLSSAANTCLFHQSWAHKYEHARLVFSLSSS